MLNDKTLLQRGLDKLNEIDGAQGEAVMQALADVAPDLGSYIIGFAFGEIYQRPHLDVQQRTTRSEERRVGKECRSRWSPYH